MSVRDKDCVLILKGVLAAVKFCYINNVSFDCSIQEVENIIDEIVDDLHLFDNVVCFTTFKDRNNEKCYE